MTFRRIILITLAIILLFSNISFAVNDSDILANEKKIMRNEIIRLKLLLGKDKADRIPVLLYHHILPEEDIIKYGWKDNGGVISLENFKAQMTYLYENNYHTATLDELDGFMKGELVLPKKTVVITFDDGYLTNGLYAYPIMQEYGQRGTVFVNKHSFLPALDFSPEGLQHISFYDNYSDVFDFESHTFNLHNKVDDKALLEIATYEEIKEDLLLSKGILNGNYIAYPYGIYSKTTLDVMEELGFKLGFTVKFGYVKSDSLRYELPRIIIYPDTSLDKFVEYIN